MRMKAISPWCSVASYPPIALAAARFPTSAWRVVFRGAGRKLLKTGRILLLTPITICNNIIADCDMTLGEKLRYLREVEGTLRGLDRELSQQEMVRLIQKEQGKSISQSYLSQIESGARPHLTNSSR